jgi:hypothetical protein
MLFKDIHFFKRTFLITILVVVTVIISYPENELLNRQKKFFSILDSNENYSSLILSILKNETYSELKSNDLNNHFSNESLKDCPLIPDNLSKFNLKKKTFN